MKSSKFMGRLLRSTVLSGAAIAAASPAFAQDDDTETDDVVVVTGTRLKDANIEATSPVSTIGAEAFDIRGVNDTIDLLNQLPQITPGLNSQNTGFANGANGTSTINLRGLGETRTLVLIDGKRLPYGSPTQGGFASDVNLVPTQLIERVEIVTGGASAVYGSDAIAGVANFIMKKDFEGFEIDGQFGFNHSGNNTEWAQNALINAGFTPVQGATTGNETWDISGLMGANIDGGRGNVTAYFRYLRNNGLQMGERDWAQAAIFEQPTAGQRIAFGSNNGPFPTSFFVPALLDGIATAMAPLGNPIPLVDEMGNTLLDGNGAAITTQAFSLDATGNTFTDGFNNPFNFNPFNPLVRSVERFNAGFNGSYEISDTVNAYMTFGFTQSNSPQIIAPSAAFSSSISMVNCDNPLLSAALLARLCGTDTGGGVYSRDVADGTTDGYAPAQIRRRFVEGGPRTDDRTLTNFRVVGGFEGVIFDDWSWDAFAQFANTSLERTQFNQVTATNMARALDIIADGSGNPVCRTAYDGTADPMDPSVGATDPTCVPFVTAYVTDGTNPAGLAAYLDTPSLTNGSLQQTVFGGTIQNSLGQYGIQSPWAENGASILFGVEYRRDQLQTQGDGTNAQGLLIGAGGAVNPTNGATEVWELFMEAAIPVIEGRQGFEDLSINGAFRYSNYGSTDFLNNIDGGDFTTSTFAAGLSWTPVEDIRIRAQYQRAIRAPNVGELFLPQNGNLTSLADPCSGTMPMRSAADCANTGLPTVLHGLVPPDAGQLNILIGGNPDLKPETANTITVGAIIQPRQVPGLTVAIDYYNIELKDEINSIPPSFTLETCLDTGDPRFCGLIVRDPTGALTNSNRVMYHIKALNENIAARKVSGIDGRVSYSYDFGQWGTFDWDYNGSYTLNYSQQPLPGTGEFDCTGYFDNSCQNPTFEYTHNFTTRYTVGDLTAAAVWRYLSGVERVSAIDSATGAITVFDPATTASPTLESESYLDLSVFYDLFDNIQLRAGVRNVFDNDPPFVPGFGPSPTGNQSGNTYPGNYDVAGRFIFTGVNIRF